MIEYSFCILDIICAQRDVTRKNSGYLQQLLKLQALRSVTACLWAKGFRHEEGLFYLLVYCSLPTAQPNNTAALCQKHVLFNARILKTEFLFRNIFCLSSSIIACLIILLHYPVSSFSLFFHRMVCFLLLSI
jgi:hypothetical protein